MRVQTVLGPVDPGSIGQVSMHEHIKCDFWKYHLELNYDGILDDEDLLESELRQFRDAGGRTIVDATTLGIGRDPLGLARLARAADVHIVMGADWYRERVYPPEVFERTSNQLADVLIREFADGVADTGVRPGIIGESAPSDSTSPPRRSGSSARPPGPSARSARRSRPTPRTSAAWRWSRSPCSRARACQPTGS